MCKGFCKWLALKQKRKLNANSFLIKKIYQNSKTQSVFLQDTHCSRYSFSSRMASRFFPWAFRMAILRFLAAYGLTLIKD